MLHQEATLDEAFCQVFCECPLDIGAAAAEFLPAAVSFCNDQLFGSLCATVLIDNDTRKVNETVLQQAVADLKYGGIAVNGNGAMLWAQGHLTWGGCESEKDTLETGKGNFGNVFGFKHVQKSIIYDTFVSPSHPIWKNKDALGQTLAGLTSVALNPSWLNHTSHLVCDEGNLQQLQAKGFLTPKPRL